MAPTSLPVRSKAFWLVVAVAMVAPLDMPPLSPGLPVIASHFGVSAARAGLVITAYALPGALAAPAIGALADRYGRKRVLVPTLVLYGAAGLAVPLAPSFGAVLALRVVQGLVGGSIFASLAYALIGDRFDGARRNAAMGATTAAVSVTIAVGPVVGGRLSEVVWWGPFLVYAPCVLVGLAVLVGFGSDAGTGTDGGGEDGPDAGAGTGGGHGGSYLRDALGALPLGRAAAVYGVTFLAYGLFFGGVLAGVPFLLAETYALSPGAIGALLTAATLLSAVVSALNGRFARHLTDEGLLALSFVGYAVGFGLLWASGSPLGVAAGVVCFGAGHGLFQPSVAAALSTLGPERFRGGVLSLRTSVVLAAGAAGPPAYTVPAAAVGYGPLYLASALLALGCAVVGLATVDVRARRAAGTA